MILELDLGLITPRDNYSYGIFNLTFADLERSDQSHLLKNRVYVRDSAIVALEH